MIDFNQFPDITLTCTDRTVSLEVRGASPSTNAVEIRDGDVNSAVLDVLGASEVLPLTPWVRSIAKLAPQVSTGFTLRLWVENGEPRYEFRRGAHTKSGDAPTNAVDLVKIVS